MLTPKVVLKHASFTLESMLAHRNNYWGAREKGWEEEKGFSLFCRIKALLLLKKKKICG